MVAEEEKKASMKQTDSEDQEGQMLKQASVGAEQKGIKFFNFSLMRGKTNI